MSIKLLIGKLITAWRVYPKARQVLKSIPCGPPIFVTGVHRSGTTWVAQMLAYSGIWYIHEPFNPNKGFWPDYFSYLRTQSTYPRVDRLMEDYEGL